MEKFSLNGEWKITSKTYDVIGKVPGSVYSALLEKGLMEDPFYRDNEPKALAIMDEEFTFTKQFQYVKKSKSVLLVCEGLDTLCDLFINGQFVAHTDNMHRTYFLEVSPYLCDGDNEIKAVFPSFDAYIKAKNKEKKLTTGAGFALEGFTQVRKANYMSGWDWGPRLPDAGIWRDIYLIDGDLPRITETRILQRHDDGKVFLCVSAETSVSAETNITLITPSGEKIDLQNGVETEIKNPQLWWPNGYGEQPLYSVCVEVFVGGMSVDTDEKKVGLRTLVISREEDEWGEEFCYKINGVKIFAFGADYIPEDNILSRLNRERTKKLLEDCLFANFNSIRVWGGGFYPEDDFFELCDEMGIIVFMDLMFACGVVPTDDAFCENIEIEVEQNLKRIRHHACIAIISGNNEIEEEVAVPRWYTDEEREGYLKLFEGIIPKIVEKVCPEISFVPSSPSAHGGLINPRDENVGDSHYWQVWHGNLPFVEYRKHYFRFLSEFGFQSFPAMKTIEEFTLPEDRNPFSPVMELHQRNASANGKILNYLSQTYLYPTSMETLAYASQLLQAEAIKYGVEHMRRHRGRCMGALYWQLNDCWPVASWSSIDSSDRYKALHYEAKRFFEPIHISCEETGEYSTRADITDERRIGYETKARLFINNDTMQPVNGLVEWKLCSCEGEVLESGCKQVEVEALSYVGLEEIDFHKTNPRRNYLSYAFLVDGNTISQGTVLFTKPKHFHFADPMLSARVEGDEIVVKASAYAKYVFICNENDDMVLSDNFFDMNAGERRVKILAGKPNRLQIKSVFDIR